MTGVERAYRWLLYAYPAWYRRERGDEMLDTLLERRRMAGPGSRCVIPSR